MAAVGSNASSLGFASRNLRDDRKFVLEAVRHAPGAWWVLRFASEAMRGDRALMLEAVRWDEEILELASKTLRSDKALVLEDIRAVRVKPGMAFYCAFGHASALLKTDREVVLAAVRQDGRALDYA